MEKTLEHLINEYVVGSISESDKTRLEQAMQDDESLTEKVRALQVAYRADRYVRGEMNDAEKQVFEEEMKTDALLEQEVRELAAAERFIELQQRRQATDFVQEIAKEHRDAPQRMNNRRLWLLGTLGVVIIVGGIWFLLPNAEAPLPGTESPTTSRDNPTTSPPAPEKPEQEQTPKEPISSEPLTPTEPSAEPSTANANPGPIAQLADEYAKEIHAFNETRGNPDFTAWKELYDSRQFGQLIELVKPIVDEVAPNDSEIRLALGLAYFYEDRYEAAIAQFAQLEGTTQQSNARWYRILALLQLNRPNEARPLLQDILDARVSSRKTKAQKLMDLIE